ncbi:MAG: glycosyltransferase [Candidatus Magnetomorum sp.]|nr:glycosyltransferase [Candidatus Magnetomorum sp.]
MTPKMRWAKSYYHKRLVHVYQHLIPKGKRILELGCGEGNVLAALSPSFGIGIDISGETIRHARREHPHIHFFQHDAHELGIQGTFDYILLSDLINDLWDVRHVFCQLRHLCHQRTRVIINFYSRLWGFPLWLAQKLNLAASYPPQNWLTESDVKNLLELSGFETISIWQELLMPVRIPLISEWMNRFLVRIFPFNTFAMTNMMMARIQYSPQKKLSTQTSVSVIVPARNEAGNIRSLIQRIPEMGKQTEIIFVEGGSEDQTYETIVQEIIHYPNRQCKVFRQSGQGKGDAVRSGFREASGDVLMILDADISVAPEDLSVFFEILCQNHGDMINGVRLVYPMDENAMRFWNFLGNKFFSLAFSWLLGQPIKDTLCGTKVLWKSDYQKIEANRMYFGEIDPFGDFDLLFGAVKQNFKIVDLPIRYRERIYGSTNIKRWKHGWLLLKMMRHAAMKIKFQ